MCIERVCNAKHCLQHKTQLDTAHRPTRLYKQTNQKRNIGRQDLFTKSEKIYRISWKILKSQLQPTAKQKLTKHTKINKAAEHLLQIRLYSNYAKHYKYLKTKPITKHALVKCTFLRSFDRGVSIIQRSAEQHARQHQSIQCLGNRYITNSLHNLAFVTVCHLVTLQTHWNGAHLHCHCSTTAGGKFCQTRKV